MKQKKNDKKEEYGLKARKKMFFLSNGKYLRIYEFHLLRKKPKKSEFWQTNKKANFIITSAQN